jgi:TatD DNase family protein
MLIDTHCHINMMVKKDFDRLLTVDEIKAAGAIVKAAHANGVHFIVNVGTSLPESKNCIILAKELKPVIAAIGIHPNDLTPSWRNDLKELAPYLKHKQENKVVAIGECGMDFHYPNYNIQQQKDAFRAQIELALEHSVALIVHTRDARDETLRVIEEYKKDITKGIIHCFSEDMDFAQTVIDWGFAIGIGGTITYPKNEYLRTIVKTVKLENIVLETDAPFLPVQEMRGKQNSPVFIKNIAEYIAQLRTEPFENVAQKTSTVAQRIFDIENFNYMW